MDDYELEEMRIEAQRFAGFFAGQFRPEEYAPYIQAGVLEKTYDGTAGFFLGLAKLEVVHD